MEIIQPNQNVPVLVKIIAVLSFLFTIGSLVVLYILFQALRAFSENFTPSLPIGFVVTAIVTLAISFLISRGLYRGKNWARIVFVIITIFGAVLVIWNTIRSGISVGYATSILINAGIAGYLLFNKNVKAAFAPKKETIVPPPTI